MNLSMRWLKDHIDINQDIRSFVHGMTMSGSKVEGWETEGQGIENVVVGKLISVSPHPDSDHLLICSVEVGQLEPVQIVTGAQNVKAGDIVPVALEGARLPANSDNPGGIVIRKGKLRGVESRGMLCSLGELGLTAHDFPHAITDGIFILSDDKELKLSIGQDIRDAIGLNDTVVEFEITSNRPDCLSVIGLAREAGATFQQHFSPKTPEFKGVGGEAAEYLNVKVDNTELCTRYMAGIVTDVKIEPSPLWMRERLRASGVRPINNLVDITNYVMLEYGHPMHAFDLKYVEENRIVVRNAHPGEKITTLDGIERSLSADMLAICDGKKPVAVAGVMGGEFSGIMDDTSTVVFEAACFNGPSVRITGKKLGMRTESSGRFEKGLDPENCKNALYRAFELVEELGCGKVVSGIIDCYEGKKELRHIPFDHNWINGLLGTDIQRGEMISCLELLDIEVVGGNAVAPSYRGDLERSADIAEEVARIYGYDNIPSTPLNGLAAAEITPEQKDIRDIRRVLTGMGCNEITTYSFFSPKCYDKINLKPDSKLRKSTTIKNPLGEDTSVMRTTVLPSLCEVLARNINYRNMAGRIFEIGTEYHPSEEGKLPEEPKRLAIGIYGPDCDFYLLKGMVEGVLAQLSLDPASITLVPMDENCPFEESETFHPGRSCYFSIDGQPIGIYGQIHPRVMENYGVSTVAYGAKLNFSELMAMSKEPKLYAPLPRFPAITRDLSLITDKTLRAAAIEKAIKEGAGKYLESVKLFDLYEGQQIEAGKKSISYSLTLRSKDSTLTDQQADKVMSHVLKALEEIGAQLRG